MNNSIDAQSNDNTSQDCSSNASTHTSTVSSNESAESSACSCDAHIQCKPCRLAKGRGYGKKHRLTIKKKASLVSQERATERTRSHELLGELTELRMTFRNLLNARPKDCIKCGTAITPSVDVPHGRLLLEKNDTSLSDCETRLQECEEHLSNLSEKWTLEADVDKRKTRRRQLCSLCDNETCEKCQTRRKSRAYATKSRANKDDNLRKCHELLRWAIDELNKQRGQIHCLRSQLKELTAQPECRYSIQDINLSMPSRSSNPAETGSHAMMPVHAVNQLVESTPWNPLYGRWPGMREDVLRTEESGWHQPPWPQALAATANPPNPVPKHQAYTHEQHGLAAWELDMSTAHEYVMAAEGVPTTMSFDATLHVGYVLSDSSAPALADVVQEVETRLSLFKLDDDDIIPPQTRTGSQYATGTKGPRTHGKAQNKDALVYELAEEEPDSDYDTISLGSEASWLRGPRRHSLRSTASTVNNIYSGSISRSTSQISVNDDQGKHEMMQVVCEEDPLALIVDNSGIRDSHLKSVPLELEKRFYIDHDLIRISRIAIGFGAFATIYKGTLLPRKLESQFHEQSVRDVAIKIRRSRYRTNHSRPDYDALQEMRILHEVGRNKHFVELIGYCYKDDEPALVMEYCERGDLRTYLRTHLRDHKTAVEHSYLSSRGFVHRLLTAQSILLASDMTVKIGTFTQCVRLSADVYYETDDEYPLFAEVCAPEVFSSMRFSVRSDVWSFGVVLYEIFSVGKTPYSGVLPRSDNHLMQWLAEGHRLEQPELCPADIYGLMLACWRQERLERPDFQEIQRYFECCSGQVCTPKVVSEKSSDPVNSLYSIKQVSVHTQQQSAPLSAM